ncbi:ATP-binding protein [Streptomyces sp. NPDC059917]|uniref:ATP-binding protein n=1 Tax=Streptomyces sp. NPDC059917 TaxID=3347002 RepID=UPI003662240C
MNARRPTPLVGRAAPLRRLVAAAAGPPCVVLVTGEGGMGKTRMIAELLASPALRERPRAVGRCPDLEDVWPLAPVIEALACLVGRVPDDLPPVTGALRPLLPELADALPAPPAPLDDHRAERHRRIRAAIALLTAVGPAVLVLEDFHWADAGTVEFLHALVAGPPPHLSVVISDRGDGDVLPTPLASLHSRIPPGVPVHECRLQPLDPDQVGEFAARVLGVDRVSGDFAEQLHRRTGGLPFAVEEVLRLLDDQDPVGFGTGAEHLALERVGVPVPVRRVMLDRLGRLPADARAVVAAAAVAAVPVDIDLLVDVTAIPEHRTRRAVGLAIEHAVLVPAAGTYAFRHTLARQAAYEAICEPERPALHLRTARALLARAAPLPLAQIAHHYQRAGRPEEWLRYTETAGDRAAARGDHTTATRHYLVARRNHPRPNGRIRLSLKLARGALSELPDQETIEALRTTLAQDDPSPAVRGELRFCLGSLMRNQAGAGMEGMEEIAAAVPDLLATSPNLAARAMSAVAVPSIKGWRVAENLEYLERAQRLAPQVDDPVQRTAIAANRATVLMLTGDSTAWQAAAALPLTPASAPEAAQLARAHANLAHAATALGHPGPAADFLSTASVLLQDNAVPYLDALAGTAHLVLSWTTGPWQGLLDRAVRAAAAYVDIPDLAAEAILVRGLLTLHAEGDTAAARRYLVAAAETTRLDTGMVLTASAGALARIHLAAGRPDAAFTAADTALHHVRRTGCWVWGTEVVPAAVEALIRTSAVDEAAHTTEDFHRGIAGRDAPAARAALATCRALLAEAEHRPGHAAARVGFEAAARAWRAAGRPHEAARALEAQGRTLLVGAQPGGELLVDAAIDAYQLLGARWDIARCRRLLRDHGKSASSRRGRIGYGDLLSPREQEVVRLAAAGATNREIAASLVLSPRTVEQHVAKAMRKLAVSSRADLPRS